jgi:hypothetical protein
MGEAGRATVEQRFSLDAMVRRIEGVYDEELVRAGALPWLRVGGVGQAVGVRSRRPVGRATHEVPPL